MPAGRLAMLLVLLPGAVFVTPALWAARLTVDLGDAPEVTLVGAFLRWDADGNPRKPVNPKAKIDQPEVEAQAVKQGKLWVFSDLKPGKYDLVIMAKGRRRIEGWHYPPVLEFDPFFPPSAGCDEAAGEFIDKDIRKSEHYENKVEPLYMGGDKQVVRVLVQLIRDKPTTYEKGAGTMRHEIWQYTWRYGGWLKEKRTKVLDRHLLQVSELRQWTWVWEPKLGAVEIANRPVELRYPVPAKPDPAQLKGLYPY